MLPQDSCFSYDDYGCPMVQVSSDHMKDFPALIAWIRKKGYGRDTGVLKLRLSADDRNDDECFKKILPLIEAKFRETIYDEGEQCHLHPYNPEVQLMFRAACADDIYEYVRGECSQQEREEFLREAICLANYSHNEQNCCSQALASKEAHKVREHYFDVIRKSAQFNNVLEGTVNASAEEVAPAPVLYGSGIQLDQPSSLRITKSFAISKLGTVLDLLKDKYDGLAYPYVYAGTTHSVFPWHIEDAGLWSINYLIKGANKLWYGIPPQYFGFMDKVASSLRINKAHASCRALLVDHKILIADPECFKVQYGVPYTTVVQEPGDFVITFPFALHSGGNLGRNLAVASNFADPDWVGLGIYTPVCACNKDQVHLDLSPVLRKCRPDLLDSYKNGTALVFPRGHPLEVLSLPAVATAPLTLKRRGLQTSAGEKKGVKDRTLFCPQCSQRFTGNKMERLKVHIQKYHSDQVEDLIRILDARYPPWKPKTNIGQKCSVCCKFIRGSSTHMVNHIKRFHVA